MIVLDANLLLYAYDTLAPQHKAAKDWLIQIFSGSEPVGLPWQTVTAFLRVSTNPRLRNQPFTVEEAVRTIEVWLEQPNVRPLSPGEQHWSFLRRMLIEGHARGPLVSDAQLAALTMENGGELYSTDRDSARFPGLRWINPSEDPKQRA